MMEVELLTREGELVTRVKVPQFKTMPDAIQWGSRLFIRQFNGKYYEGYVHYVVEGA